MIVRGAVFVFISRSPYFSALGVVLTVCGFRIILVSKGAVFPGLVLLLIYLGGMLVVFAYSAALASDRYPDSGWGVSVPLALLMSFLVVAVLRDKATFGGGPGGYTVTEGRSLLGACELYGEFWVTLLVGGFGLFVCLFVVLCLVRGFSVGALRAV